MIKPYDFQVGDHVWYTLAREYWRDGAYHMRECREVLCVIVNMTSKRVMLRLVGDPPSVKPRAVGLDKIS